MFKCKLQAQIASEVRGYEVQIGVHVQMSNENITVTVCVRGITINTSVGIDMNYI